jgi:Ala-tRNA(Pro) deacylase
MPATRLKKFLDEQRIRYVTMAHSPAYTMQQIAEAAHIPGKLMAKTVMVKLDGKMAMVVIPAAYRVNLDLVREAVHASRVELANEDDFKALFPDVEIGAMPPFGNLYGLPVYVAETLTKDAEIAFNAGTHTEIIKLAYADFARLARPTVVKALTHEAHPASV